MDSLNVERFATLITDTQPWAVAFLEGGELCPQLEGLLRFYPAAAGTQVVAEVFGLPEQVGGQGVGPFFALHIHGERSCGDGGEGGFVSPSMGRYHPGDLAHPWHAGDLPPLLSSGGYAFCAVYTGRFTPEEVAGRTAAVHREGASLQGQPPGYAGGKLACGIITPVRRGW